MSTYILMRDALVAGPQQAPISTVQKPSRRWDHLVPTIFSKMSTVLSPPTYTRTPITS